jgi:hypothetical protein
MYCVFRATSHAWHRLQFIFVPTKVLANATNAEVEKISQISSENSSSDGMIFDDGTYFLLI